MKKNKYIILIILLLGLSSCSDFLDYKENDKMIPKTIENFSEFLYGEVINKKFENFTNLFFAMSDDWEEKVIEISDPTYDSRNDLKPYYLWNKNPEETVKGTIEEDKIWAALYHKILICNIILEEINKLEPVEMEKNEKFILEAEALFLKANAYFRLLNVYGEPYENEEQAKLALGVPINDEVGVSEKIYTRTSVKKVYEEIEKLLLKSIKLFEEHRREYPSVFRPNLDVARLLLSRTYLYQKKYDKTVSVCDKLIENTGRTIYNLNKHDAKRPISIKTNTGVLFTYELIEYKNTSKSSTYWGAANELLKMYSIDDLRKDKFFYSKLNTMPYKYSGVGNLKGKSFRIEEAYLNRAEALLSTNYKKAIDDINEIRKYKFVRNYEILASSEIEATKIVRDERRRELCFELHRWFDLRRYGCPKIRHRFTESASVSRVYVLEEKSPNYTLPIPTHILKLNQNIKNVSRINVKFE